MFNLYSLLADLSDSEKNMFNLYSSIQHHIATVAELVSIRHCCYTALCGPLFPGSSWMMFPWEKGNNCSGAGAGAAEIVPHTLGQRGFCCEKNVELFPMKSTYTIESSIRLYQVKIIYKWIRIVTHAKKSWCAVPGCTML